MKEVFFYMDKLKKYRGLCLFIEGEYKFIEQLKEMEVFADTTEYQRQSYERIEEWEQERQQIADYIKNIPNERYRVMYYLFYIKGYTKRAIAEQLGIDERYLHRLWRKSEKELTPYE